MKHPLFPGTNPLCSSAAEGQLQLGVFQIAPGTMITEAASVCPIDWVVLDAEAGPASRTDILQFIQVLSGTPVSPVIRVKNHNAEEIEFCLDAGAKGIMVPKVNTPAQADKLARTTRYPPEGNRGVNPVRASGYFSFTETYFSTASQNIFLAVQVESEEAVSHADEIAAVPGVSCLFIGMGDLAMSLGQPGVVTGEKMDRARKEVLAACRKHGKVSGIFAYSESLAKMYIGEGFEFVALGNELKFFKTAVTTIADTLRQSR